jgi:phosphoglycolate phosphatase
MKALHPHIHGKRHIIWDWNGTLLNDIEHAVRINNQMLSDEGLKPVTLEQYKKSFGFPVIDYYRKLGFDTSPESFHELCERFNHYFQGGLGQCELWPGTVETLQHVKAEGLVQSVLSASQQQILEASIAHFGLQAYFDHLVGIADKKAGSKIDRGRQLIQMAGVDKAHTMMIGDTDHDHEVAEALGIDLLLVEHGQQHADRLRAIHHRVIKVF